MPKHSIHNDIKVVQHLSCAAYTATQTPSNGVDLAGFNACEFVIDIGTVTNIANSPQPSWAFKVQESDSQSSDFTDVTTAADLIVDSAASPVTTPDSTTGVFLTIDDGDNDDAVYRVGYVGSKRYARVVATAANTPGSTPMAIDAILAKPDLRPTAD